MSLRIIGGASFPGVIGTLSVSVPLACLTADAQGVALDLRPGLLKRVNRRLIDPSPAMEQPCWSVRWDEIASVDVGPRSLVFYVSQGRGARFVVLKRAALAPLVREIEEHDVPARRTSGTIGWFFRRDAWAARGKKP